MRTADVQSDLAREAGIPDISADRFVGGADTRDGLGLQDTRDGRAADAEGDDAPATLDSGTDGGAKLADAKDAAADRPLDSPNKDTNPDIKKLDSSPDVPPPNGCLNPIVIPSNVPMFDVTVNTVGEPHKFDLPCGSAAPDVVLRFTLPQTELVYADTFGANWNTVLHFSKSCPPSDDAGEVVPGTAACSDDACATTQSQAIALSKDHPFFYLYLSGADGESGSATIHFQHAGVGTGLLKQLAAGAGTVSGTTNKETTAPNEVCEAWGGTDNYWWSSCPNYAGGTLSASTCTGTTFDTVVALQVPRTKLIVCEDDTEICGHQSLLNSVVPAGAGLNVISVFGGTYVDSGPYVLTYTRP